MPSLTDAPPEVGAPLLHGALAVHPLFGQPGEREVLSFVEAHAHGLTVHELPGVASVNDVLVANPLDVAVLLYGGEEVLGAQQHRSFDVSVLVGPRCELQVPVTCEEAGRWDGSGHANAFDVAPHASPASVRAIKDEAVAQATTSAGGARDAQHAVWDEVGDHVEESLEAGSPTGALHDAFAARGDELDAAGAAIARQDGQTGALVTIAGRFTVLDHVSRPEVWAALHARMVKGYALDAARPSLAGLPAAVKPVAPVTLVEAAFGSPLLRRRPSVGLGEEVRLGTSGLRGTALRLDDELVALTAFAAGDPGGDGRIQRPSRRR